MHRGGDGAESGTWHGSEAHEASRAERAGGGIITGCGWPLRRDPRRASGLFGCGRKIIVRTLRQGSKSSPWWKFRYVATSLMFGRAHSFWETEGDRVRIFLFQAQSPKVACRSRVSLALLRTGLVVFDQVASKSEGELRRLDTSTSTSADLPPTRRTTAS